MKPHLNKLRGAVLPAGILLLLALFSCKKDPYQIGVDLLPPTDTLNVRYTDTCTIEAFSVIQDSTRTDKVSSLILGSTVDPVFGKLTCSMYTQVRLASEGVDFGSNPVLDSVVLVLFYEATYGDTLTRQNLKVYEISEDFDYDSVFFSQRTLNTYPTLLADQDYTPRPSDSVAVFGDTIAPHLRVNLSKLTNYFGNKILQAPSGALETSSEFIKFMKGLYIQSTPVSSGGAIINYSIASGASQLVVYYHNGDDPEDDSLQYKMPINSACARFVHIDHNGFLEAGTDLKQQIINHDSARGARQLFLQGMAGVKVKLKFPYMKNFGNGKKIAINDAVLELNNAETDTTHSPPSSLIIIRQDSASRIGYMPDASEGSGYYGGFYRESTNSYFFRITQYMQKIIHGDYTSSFDLFMVVNDPIKTTITPNRVILNGINPLDPSASKLRLRVTYTVLN